MNKERPILFNTEMVQAILADKNTMTRRIVKPQPVKSNDGKFDWIDNGAWKGAINPKNGNHNLKCPYGEVGDILWVRETWAQLDMDYRAVSGKLDIQEFKGCPIAYKADNDAPGHFNYWRPSAHMPRTAARILLKVANIRVERLQDITEEDAMNEGVARFNATPPHDYRLSFIELWEEIYGFGAWDVNPWVWVVEFERTDGDPDGL